MHGITGRVDQHQLADALRLSQGEVPGDIATKGVAGDIRLVHLQVIEQLAKHVHHALDRIDAVARRTGEAEPRNVEADDAVMRGESLHPPVPGVQRSDHAVDQ